MDVRDGGYKRNESTFLLSNHLQIVAHWLAVRLMVTSFAVCQCALSARPVRCTSARRVLAGTLAGGDCYQRERHLHVGLQLEGPHRSVGVRGRDEQKSVKRGGDG